MNENKIIIKDHWQKVYSNSAEDKLGWYEETPDKSLGLIQKCALNSGDLILDAGSGASTLIDHLLMAGYNNIVAADISRQALEKSRKRLGGKATGKVLWLADDITKSKHIVKLSEVCLWHDRAVLHFLTGPEQRDAYKALLDKVLAAKGYVIIATFSLKGAQNCSGLPVYNYDHKMLEDFLGPRYKLLTYFDYLYLQPSGNARPFVYTLFQRME